MPSRSTPAVGLFVAFASAFLTTPAAALSQGTALSFLAVLQVAGTLLFSYLGVYADKDFFLLLGNLVCGFGAVVWVWMLSEEEGNPTWITFFAVMGGLSAYSTFSVFNKYRLEGFDDDDDSDDEAEAEAEADARAAAAQQDRGATPALPSGKGQRSSSSKKGTRQRRDKRSRK